MIRLRPSESATKLFVRFSGQVTRAKPISPVTAMTRDGGDS
jgi:hypothetical protein